MYLNINRFYNHKYYELARTTKMSALAAHTAAATATAADRKRTMGTIINIIT